MESQRCFSYLPVIWNQLHVSVHPSTSVSAFKFSLKTFLFLKTLSSVPISIALIYQCVCVLAYLQVCVFVLRALNAENMYI